MSPSVPPRAAALILLALGLAGCDIKSADNAAAPVDTAATNTGAVTREQVQREETPPPPPPVAAIQTQPGPDGSTVSLNKVAVTGDILTVQLSYGGVKCCHSQTIRLDEVSVVDDATAQRLGVLKDNAGKPLAAPLQSNGEALSFMLDDSAQIVWIKFPAPPATSRTVSINIPDVAPFDGVAVAR